MLNVASLAVIAVLSAADASGAPPASSAPPAAAKPAADPLDRIVCRSEETTGTRLGGHKTCMTMRDWQDLQRQTSQDMREGHSRGLTYGPHGG
jgi:hypothetical protein